MDEPVTMVFSAPEVQDDGSVWALCLYGAELLEARMVVDTDYPEAPFLLPASPVWGDLSAASPLGELHDDHCPSWRWATELDLRHWENWRETS
ncbi:hypothetical protein GCM10010174_34940 [Kutzneria viridogrisea]|uniref:Uncharacterized protein n=1 Tax=Kutzneria viridogrisea TaxID=47990 RepID=A0ABR6BLX9_9PSEU|nr:hypothetical protein [Kutzneria viridogrisea]